MDILDLQTNSDILMFDVRKRLRRIENSKELLKEWLQKLDSANMVTINLAFKEWQLIEPRNYCSLEEFSKDYKNILKILDLNKTIPIN